MPRYRSAAYAILMALYENGNGQVGTYLSKRDLMVRAQPYSETSMDTPAAGQTFAYSGWSCVKTLLDHGLIHKYGNPHQFGITTEGVELAQAMKEGRQRMETASTTDRPQAGVGQSAPSQSASASIQHTASLTNTQPTSDSPTIDRDRYQTDPLSLNFSYEDGDGRSVNDKDEAAVDIFGNSVGYKIRIIGLQPPTLPSGLIRVTNPRNDQADVYILDEHAPQLSPAAASPSVPTRDTMRLSGPFNSNPGTPPAPLKADITRLPDELIFLVRGSFDVHLVLDSREIGDKRDRTYFHEQLLRANTKTLTRALELGDFLWVAKERYGEQREVVLNHIVERKRMDDLVASIKDGRYKEQKFRLANTAANIIYLIEESSAPDLTFKDAVETVMAQISVLHGFTLKRTSTRDDTAAFLAMFTKKLADLYERNDIYALHMRDFDVNSVADVRKGLEARDGKQVLLLFEAYQAMTTKSKNLVLQDIWTKQLMSIRGVSAEKASKLVARYPTMRR
ncbi:Crossover junction endonuclease mus81 [Rhizophlyctis rosea]|nr:Crossover junction endonuclease mus81 [Rhizophlyctis rosea]